MSSRRLSWSCLSLLPLFSGCVISHGQRPQTGPALVYASPSVLASLEPCAWLPGGLGLLILCLCLGCLPALGALWWLGAPRWGRLARRLRRPWPSTHLRLRLLLRELESLLAADRRQAKVVSLPVRLPRRR